MRNPYLPLFWLVVVEQPDPQVDEVVRAALFQGEDHVELSHTDVGSPMLEKGRREAPLAADVLEMRSEGVYQVV